MWLIVTILQLRKSCEFATASQQKKLDFQVRTFLTLKWETIFKSHVRTFFSSTFWVPTTFYKDSIFKIVNRIKGIYKKLSIYFVFFLCTCILWLEFIKSLKIHRASAIWMINVLLHPSLFFIRLVSVRKIPQISFVCLITFLKIYLHSLKNTCG